MPLAAEGGLVTGKTEELHQGLPVVTFTDGAGFERWLKSHGAKSAGTWLKLAKKGAPAKSLTKAEAIDAALCHGWIDGQLDACDDHYWLVRFTPRKPRSKWSRINRARAAELLALGRIKPHGLAQIEAAKADGRWASAYAPARVAEVPPDLSTALKKNAKAAAFFATLKGANRYSILHRIGAVKKAETRARKIAHFVEMLERGETIHK
jgi:uncharacterized protein YdeI (YjbR/CyaY-like superfamily)